MRICRILLAGLSLVAMTMLFVLPTAAVCRYCGCLAKVQLVPAILGLEFAAVAAIAVATVLWGRVYCAVVCPLGISQDLARMLFRLCRIAKNHVGKGRIAQCARYVILALFFVGAFFGGASLIEPYGIFGRFVSVALRRSGEPGMLAVVWAIALFAFILLTTAFGARWWCNAICPVGTLLGLVSRFAIFRIRIDREKCVGCGLCAKACDKGAIVKTAAGISVDNSVCVSCMNCRGVCAKGAMR